ncbi:lipid II flippase MurJ [Actinomadura algeriensis]|uniref:Peptidoglycan lipid II flippase n=1 Tax=Actinomadura algeriensis TaxID=1679523 RepID=A0ABR9JMH8_9ACTN|nr:lipid II flippase MurJ [Actinomadura algeriensis]MBE1531769.1 putative peptidoglycan lipid II flippase [Actinomadura algeriensis]
MTATASGTKRRGGTPAARASAGASRPPGSVGRAAALSGVLVAAGTGLGFLRDLVMAHLFGADRGTDAFLVAWTIPETVSPLLIEDAMALLMVPAVTRLLARGDGLRPFVGRTLPRIVAGLAVVTVTIALAAPAVVGLLAPGLPGHGPAELCVRLTAITVVTFGIAGFMSATLRAHHRFGPPAAIYAAYNVGILALIAGLSGAVGVTSAAIGVACGSVLMVAVQAPAFARCLREAPPSRLPAPDELRLGLAAVVPVVVYTVTRQAQVFVERFIGSGLAAGSISQLNYAQKVAQVPMIMSLLIVTVTFPRLARASADGDVRGVARRIRQDLAAAGAMVLCATSFLVAFAPAVIEVLFEHGAFSADDTRRTAAIMQVYALGLWGHMVVGLAARAFFAQGRPMWTPAGVLAGGLVVTAAIGAAFAASAGPAALAAANAAGITLAAVLLLAGLRLRVAPVALRGIAADTGRLLLASAGACAAGRLAATALGTDAPAPLVLAVGGPATAAAFALLLALAGRDLAAPWLAPLASRLTARRTGARSTFRPRLAVRPLAIRPRPARRGRVHSGETSDTADRPGQPDGPGTATGTREETPGTAGADVPLDRPPGR